MQIRELHQDELWLCSQFGEAFHREKQLDDAFSFEVFHQHWTSFYAQGTGQIFGLFNDQDQLIGGIGGIVVPDLTSGRLKLYELFWFVDEGARHSTGRWPMRLVTRLRAWGREKKATKLRMVRLLKPGESPTQGALDRLYTNVLHLRPLEVCFEGPIEES